MKRIEIHKVFKKSVENIKDPSDLVKIFAPIEPITANPVLRELMGRNGAQLLYRPKIRANHLMKAQNWQYLEKIPQIENLTTFTRDPVYDGFQLIAKNKDPIKYAIKFIDAHAQDIGVQFIDLNFCCPGYKVRPQDRGGELLKKPLEIIKVIDQVLKYTDLPVSIKIRRGYTIKDSPFSLCQRIKNEFGSNISWIAINRAPVKMEGVNEAKLRSDISPFIDASQGLERTIPLIANGDIWTPADIKRILESHTVNGYMIGRAALGNPWIFKDLHHSLPSESKSFDNFQRIITQQLEDLFHVIEHYLTEKGRTWVKIGKLKALLYYFIKNYYKSIREDLPSGFGFSTWHTSHFSKDEFIEQLNRGLPFLSHDQWVSWLHFL